MTNNNYINTNILSGAIVDMDTSIFTGSSSTFTIQPGGTIATGHPLGLNGNINVGGAKALSNAANYIFNGSIAQITGTFLPDSVANLTINNAAGVVLSQATTINDTLFLKSGLFDNTIPFTEGSNFKLVIGNGSIKNPVTGVDNAKVLPLSFNVEQNYPNPFNPSTTINFSLKSEAVVTIKIYSILGKEVRTLVNEERPSGNYSVLWNGCDNAGISVASGTYFYRYTAGNITQVKKMVLLK
ncbi:MAG: T9SS type A sorting domain-containing protein [Ignavibacteriaceae bacterium]